MLKRDRYCTDIKEKDVGTEITVCGWVNSWRDHGGVIFIDLRDVSGILQVVFNPEISKECHAVAEKLRSEDVIAAKGVVELRSEETINPKMPTGKVEVKVHEVEILNKSLTPPFEISDESINVGEEHRLTYRYLDLRRAQLQKNIKIRHQIVQEIRNFLNSKNFLEIETPVLGKSTPEGARDYLIPSRVNPGKFYALPQSPQIFKQLLMISGFDKYYQIARCFRDEDLRKDRQPEFTQLDMEMSFIDEEDIYSITEDLFEHVIEKVFNKKIKTPFPKFTYDEVMNKYGIDKPDLRFKLELTDITDLVDKTDFEVFKEVVSKKGVVKCINIPEGARLSRKEIDDLTSFVSVFGAKGLAWIKITEKGPASVIVKYFPEQILNEILKRAGSKKGDIVFFVADKPKIVYDSLGNLRNKIAEMFKLKDKDELDFVWVNNFPLFEYDIAEKRLVPMHHPFTHPKIAIDKIGSDEEIIKNLKEKPESLYARSYDLVLNGEEIGGGSIRIHHRKLQEEMFSALGFNKEAMEEQFGFLLRALQYGAPPHGGIAPGLDRIVWMLLQENSIRDVIPFPKTQKAVCLMSNSPSEVSEKQLKELGLKLNLI